MGDQPHINSFRHYLSVLISHYRDRDSLQNIGDWILLPFSCCWRLSENISLYAVALKVSNHVRKQVALICTFIVHFITHLWFYSSVMWSISVLSTCTVEALMHAQTVGHTSANSVSVQCIYCFGGTYRLHLQGRKIRERGTSVSRWLQTKPSVENSQLYKNWRGGREGEWAHGKLIERRGEGSVEMRQQVTGQSLYRILSGGGGGGGPG
jgi:hypothetical protein